MRGDFLWIWIYLFCDEISLPCDIQLVPLCAGTKAPSPHLSSAMQHFLAISPHQDHEPLFLPPIHQSFDPLAIYLFFLFLLSFCPFVISLAAPNIKIGGKRAQKRLLRRRGLRVPRRARGSRSRRRWKDRRLPPTTGTASAGRFSDCLWEWHITLLHCKTDKTISLDHLTF